MSQQFFHEPLDTFPICLGFHNCVLNYPSHYHLAFEAVFVFKGSVTLTSDAGTFQLSPGDIGLISSLVIHGYSSTEYSESCTVIFENETFSEVEDFIPVNSRQQVIVLRNIAPEVSDTIRYHLHQAAHYQRIQDTPLCVNHSKILLIHLLRTAAKLRRPRDTVPGWRDEKIGQSHKILMFIQAHYHEAVSLELISRKLHMDKFEASRIINHHLGTSVSDLVNKYRLLDACRLLKTTRLAMPMVAAQAGFSSESAMYRNFKKVFHISPSQYRKENQ